MLERHVENVSLLSSVRLFVCARQSRRTSRWRVLLCGPNDKPKDYKAFTETNILIKGSRLAGVGVQTTKNINSRISGVSVTPELYVLGIIFRNVVWGFPSKNFRAELLYTRPG